MHKSKIILQIFFLGITNALKNKADQNCFERKIDTKYLFYSFYIISFAVASTKCKYFVFSAIFKNKYFILLRFYICFVNY